MMCRSRVILAFFFIVFFGFDPAFSLFTPFLADLFTKLFAFLKRLFVSFGFYFFMFGSNRL
jgi:hypothetical protein